MMCFYCVTNTCNIRQPEHGPNKHKIPMVVMLEGTSLCQDCADASEEAVSRTRIKMEGGS